MLVLLIEELVNYALETGSPNFTNIALATQKLIEG
jgi:hypothetical protein